MSMFCYQCQEAAKGTGCAGSRGVCGVTDDVIGIQDLAVHLLKGASIYAQKAREKEINTDALNTLALEVLFTTITNANFKPEDARQQVSRILGLRQELKTALENRGVILKDLPDCARWTGDDAAIDAKAEAIDGHIDAPNEDVRSLRALVLYGLKGLAAYTLHAHHLGFDNPDIYDFVYKALAAMTDDAMDGDTLTALVLETGKVAVDAMALLDRANTETYGHPEITEVNIGVGSNPGILISGHDLKDMEELLKQTEGTGVDVYTHSEMLPANYYPAFKKYSHFVGNYGNAWHLQSKEFESFNGPILMTTNCITPVKDSYKDRIFTTGVAGYTGVKHIPEGDPKDFSELIELAKTCPSPTEIETGAIVGGFAHQQVMALADKVVEAVQAGAIKRFVVMAGCDGRQKSRSYFTDVAEALPKDTVILTAGCAKYRYNKLNLGDIGGIPRVLDAGQCNDSYSLAVIALKLKEVFGLEDVNDLPLSFDIAWYEQKAVAVLLALLHLGFKTIRLGPTLPAFLSPNVAKVLVETFDIKPIATVEEDVKAMMAGM